MIGYKDRWWCADSDHCENAEGCNRVLTPADKDDATRWWGSEDFPIQYAGGHDCYAPKE